MDHSSEGPRGHPSGGTLEGVVGAWAAQALGPDGRDGVEAQRPYFRVSKGSGPHGSLRQAEVGAGSLRILYYWI